MHAARKSSHVETAAVQMQCVEASQFDAQSGAWPRALRQHMTIMCPGVGILHFVGLVDADDSHVGCGDRSDQLSIGPLELLNALTA
jgi:hypothetical protein